MDLKPHCKYFLDFLIGLIFISLNLVHNHAHSKDLSYLSELSKSSSNEASYMSIGCEGVYMFAETRDDYKSIFRKQQPGTNFYVAHHWNKVMFEVGYLSTTRKAKLSKLLAGNTIFGVRVAQPIEISGKVRFRNTHLGFNFFTNLYDNVDVVTAVGVGFVRPHITVLTTTLTGAPFNLREIVSKTSFVPRAGIGMCWTSSNNKNLALRAMGYFDQYSRIRFRLPLEPYNKPFRNSCAVTVGFMFKL